MNTRKISASNEKFQEDTRMWLSTVPYEFRWEHSILYISDIRRHRNICKHNNALYTLTTNSLNF